MNLQKRDPFSRGNFGSTVAKFRRPSFLQCVSILTRKFVSRCSNTNSSDQSDSYGRLAGSWAVSFFFFFNPADEKNLQQERIKKI